MRKFMAVLVSLAFLPLASIAMAGGNHPMAGCGLVYMLGVRDNSNKALQTLASTFNNFYGTQSFGITSGTAGCTPDGQLALNKEAAVFIEVNLDQIRYEMARGEGAYLNALVALLGAEASDVPNVVRFLQGEYENLFPTEFVSAEDFVKTLQVKLNGYNLVMG